MGSGFGFRSMLTGWWGQVEGTGSLLLGGWGNVIDEDQMIREWVSSRGQAKLNAPLRKSNAEKEPR